MSFLRIRYGVSRLVVVKNREEAYTPFNMWGEQIVLRGTNTSHEFSAWMEGITEIGDSLDPGELVLCGNDTLVSHGRLGIGDYIDLLFHTRSKLAAAMLSGFISTIPSTCCSINGHPMLFNVCSKLFFVRQKILTNDLILDAMAAAESYVGRREDRRLSEGYFQFLDNWIHGGDSVSWYRARPASEMPLSEKKMKATMILCEHFLTYKAHRSIVPVERSTIRNFIAGVKRVVS